MDVSVTEANLNDAAAQFGCNLETHCSVLGRWDLREIDAEKLDAAILKDPKQAFVASEIPKLHFVKSTEKDLSGWKRKDDYDMSNGLPCYRYICPLKYRSK